MPEDIYIIGIMVIVLFFFFIKSILGELIRVRKERDQAVKDLRLLGDVNMVTLIKRYLDLAGLKYDTSDPLKEFDSHKVARELYDFLKEAGYYFVRKINQEGPGN